MKAAYILTLSFIVAVAFAQEMDFSEAGYEALDEVPPAEGI